MSENASLSISKDVPSVFDMSKVSLKSIKTMLNNNENVVSFVIIIITMLIIIIAILYYIYNINKLESTEVTNINTLYPSLNGNIKSINESDSDCSGNLYDYYIKTAYNACSGGTYKNDFVDINILKAIIKQGVRCLDFEIYSVNDQPVVSTSMSDNYYVKETYNSINFVDVMEVIKNYAFSSGTAPNPTDPVIVHLRIKSNNQPMYSNLASILKSYDSFMLGKEYSYEYSFENQKHNLGKLPLLSFRKKIILIVDKINNAYLENNEFYEYVNLVSNAAFMRTYTFYNIVNNPDTVELTEYNKQNMTIVFPDNDYNPSNPNPITCNDYGCQMVAMRYQLPDNFLKLNNDFFNDGSYAFKLKPANLRYEPVILPDPTPQNPNYSYGTRNVTTDYYSFDF
jgi:hypothetical protein